MTLSSQNTVSYRVHLNKQIIVRQDRVWVSKASNTLQHLPKSHLINVRKYEAAHYSVELE